MEQIIQIRKTIRVFFASSEELTNDRNAFGNLIRRLNNAYEKRGIRIELFEWEDYDAAYNDRRKQDEYNDKVRQSDMFLAVFHRVAGKFTIEEFNVATDEFRRKASPKVYAYCKDLQPGEEESQELKDFKKRLFDEMGHYWSRYANQDTMQLHFVMQLQLVEAGSRDALKVENGQVMLDGMTIARMDQLPFAAGNKGYQQMKEELDALPAKIEKARKRVEKDPDDEDYRSDLQELLNRQNALRDEFAKHQQALFDTAKRISEMQLERVSSELRRAIEEFEAGRVEAANAILDGIEIEAERHLEQLDRDRTLIHQDIEALLLKTKTLMADTTLSIEERIQQTWDTYQKADDWAERSALPKERYAELLDEYRGFLIQYAKYEDALNICLRASRLCKEVFGTEHPDTARSYNDIGAVYDNQGDYAKALEYYQKALEIQEKVLDIEHPNTATSYNNIGYVYTHQGDYAKALGYYQKALEIREKVLGKEHPNTAMSYNNIGGVYYYQGDYANALEYFIKALEIRKKVFGIEHPDTAMSYNNIGGVYSHQGDYDKALEFYQKALGIRENVLGKEHPDTARSYNNIGLFYDNQGDYAKALGYYQKALEIREKVLGKEHPQTAGSYNNIGAVYDDQGDYAKALEYYKKALEIWEKVLGIEHPNTASLYNNIGYVYKNLCDYAKALEFYQKALEIRESVLGIKHPHTAESYNNIGAVCDDQGDYEMALEYYQKALEIWEKVLGIEHPYMASLYNNIGVVYYNQGDYPKALEYYQKALEIQEKVLGTEHPTTQTIRENIEALSSKE